MREVDNVQQFRHGLTESGRMADVDLTGGNVDRVFRVDGLVRLTHLSMIVTEACQDKACNMSWVLHGDIDDADRTIGDSINIANAAVGDIYVSELDQTTLIKTATGSAALTGYYYRDIDGGLVVKDGWIKVILSATLSSGAGRMTCHYTPLLHNSVVVGGSAVQL